MSKQHNEMNATIILNLNLHEVIGVIRNLKLSRLVAVDIDFDFQALRLYSNFYLFHND